MTTTTDTDEIVRKLIGEATRFVAPGRHWKPIRRHVVAWIPTECARATGSLGAILDRLPDGTIDLDASDARRELARAAVATVTPIIAEMITTAELECGTTDRANRLRELAGLEQIEVYA